MQVILHLEASPGWGGQEMRILKESLGMQKRGHTVLIAAEKGSGLVKHAQDAGLIVYEVRFAKQFWPGSLWRLASIIRRHKVSLVNTHSSLDAWLGGLVAKWLKIPVIRTRHLSTPIRKGLNSYLLYNKLADETITTCKAIVPVICRQARLPEGRCRSIPTGIDPDSLRYELQEAAVWRRRMGASSGDFLVGMVCFMRSWKGVMDFLAAARLRLSPRLKWAIIGGGHAAEYMQKAKEWQLGDIVTFTGHLLSPVAACAALDAFALLSTAHEGVSQASLQAACLQKPLITTGVGGLGEVCIDRQTGFIVPAFAPDQVALAAYRLLSDPQMAARFGHNAKARVLQKFTQRHMLDQMEAAYRRCRCVK